MTHFSEASIGYETVNSRKGIMDLDQGTETGYVSDSSLNSRKDTVIQTSELTEDRSYVNRRRTKSERDKRRSSRISLYDVKNDSGSENSHSSLEQSQPRYRKRAGSKRNDSENKENAGYRRRAGSKNSPQLNRIDSMRESNDEETVKNNRASTTTLKMNSKDIYFGTWNPKERAVLDQVLHNIDLKPENRKSFKDLLKRKDSKQKKEKFTKNIESDESHTKYPFCQYNKQVEKNKKSLSGIFSGLKKFKDNILKRHDRIDEQTESEYFPAEDPLNDYVFPRKKKNIFQRFGSKKKELDMPRRRAHSTNEYGHHALTPQLDPKTNLSKARSGSTHSLKNLFNRTKSVDNLNGAFEFYANQKQIFQRTPSVTKLDKLRTSTEKLDNTKRSASQKSLNHGFEPVQPSAKELAYDDGLVLAEAKVIQPHTASQRSLQHPRPMYYQHEHIHGYYDSAYEDDTYRGYQSDRAPSVVSAYPTYNYQPPALSDTEYCSMRAHSSMSAYPYYYPQPRRLGYGPTPLVSGYYNRPGYCAPGYATPGYATPGYATPGLQSGYTSESDHSNIPPAQISMVPYHAKLTIQRSLSKNSAASNYSSNYGYMSESSFYDDEDVYGMVQPSTPPQNRVKLQRNLSKASNHSQISTIL